MTNFSNGRKVLYYIGPQSGLNGKWHQRWTGPWTITSGAGTHKVKITDTKGTNCDVSIDRLKLFKQKEMKNYMKWNEFEEMLKRQQSSDLNLDDENEN